MQHFFDKEHGDTAFGMIAGILGGMIKYFSATSIILGEIKWGADIEAVCVALICGGAGVLGKHFLTLLLRRFKPKKNKNETK